MLLQRIYFGSQFENLSRQEGLEQAWEAAGRSESAVGEWQEMKAGPLFAILFSSNPGAQPRGGTAHLQGVSSIFI